MKKGTKCPSGMTKMFERWFLQLSDHKLWPKIKEQGIESQNAEYWGSTKTGAKAARHFCGWTILRFTTYTSNICRKGASLVGMILKLRKLIPTSANCKLSNLQYCHISLPIDARCQKVRKLEERALCTVFCYKRIITFAWFAYFTELLATRKGHGYV